MKLIRYLLTLTTGGLLFVAFLILIGIWHSGGRFWEAIGTLLYASPPPPQVDVRSLIIQQVRGASELTTAVLTMEAVVPTSQDRTIGEWVVGTTKLLYIAYGEVRAGVDLSQIKTADVQVTDNSIQIRLPPPRILDSKLDLNRSTVYDYNRGFWDLGPDVAPNLQTLAQQAALQKIVGAACTNQLLEKANDRAKLVVGQLLGLSTEKPVTIETQPPSPGTCPTVAQVPAELKSQQ
ncbi:MAG: DUF4230 domain-containing protein [Leptolyngbyaceae bacterium]|nr:DUF4230 domain-containing protein [Leptolyngbyaceae bacterium]